MIGNLDKPTQHLGNLADVHVNTSPETSKKRVRFDSVEKQCSNNVPILLIGNKEDLDSRRKVPRSMGEQLAQSIHCLFIETTCVISNGNVEEAMQLLIDRLLVVSNNNDDIDHHQQHKNLNENNIKIVNDNNANTDDLESSKSRCSSSC